MIVVNAEWAVVNMSVRQSMNNIIDVEKVETKGEEEEEEEEKKRSAPWLFLVK